MTGSVLSPDNRFIYVNDTFNGLLRRIDIDAREVRTLLGRPQVTAVVDGDAGTARLSSNRGITISLDGGVLFLADGPTIRRVDLNRLEITTIAGTPGMSGYVDGQGPSVRFGGLLHDLEMGADDRTVYIADRTNRVIRTVDTVTGAVATVAGNRDAGERNIDGTGPAAVFSGIGGLHRQGNTLFVADTFNHTLRTVDLTTFEVRTVAGRPGTSGIENGLGTDAGTDAGLATFDLPQGVTSDGTSLYALSWLQGILRRTRLTDLVTDTVVGRAGETWTIDGPPATARLGCCMFGPPLYDSSRNRVYLSDSSEAVRIVDLSSFAVSTLVGPVEPDRHRDGLAAESRFRSPEDVVVNGAGDGGADVWFISDPGSRTIRRFDRRSNMVTTVTGAPNEGGSTDGPLAVARFGSPSGLAFDPRTNRLFVADRGLHVIRQVDLTSGMVSTLAGDPNADPPTGYVEGTGSSVRFNFGSTGARLVLTPDGQTLYVSDTGNRVIRAVNTSTGAVTRLAGALGDGGTADGPALLAQFRGPVGLALDPTAARLYVADRTAQMIRVVNIDAGTVSTVAGINGVSGPADGLGALADGGPGTADAGLFANLGGPTGLALNASGTALYVAEVSNHAVRRIDLVNNTVSTYLGGPTRRGGMPPQLPVPFPDVTFNFPETVAVTGNDLLVVSDYAIYLARPASTP